MANKKINQLDPRTGAALTDLSLVGDPTSGTSFKLTIQDISVLMGVPGKFNQPTGTIAQYLRGDGSLATFPSLTGFVPYTGATTNVNLGEFALTAGQLTLDTSPTGTAAVGTTRWNDTIGSSETTLKGGSVILKNGVDLVARIVNKVTPNATLTKAAYQAVRVSGAQGQRLAVAYAQANNDANSADTIGLVCETIATNQEGFIICVGQIENINTTGSLQGESWADGDVLYLSPFTPGAITKVKPTGNGHIVVIGYVEYAHVNNGKIYVKVMNGWELDELHDVSIVSPANNEALIYESSTSLWKNKTIATALGYTPVTNARTLTINGTAFDLSADRSWTIAAGITGSGVANQLTYWNGTGSVTGSAGLTFASGNLGYGGNGTVQHYLFSTNSSTPVTQIKNSGGSVILNLTDTGLLGLGAGSFTPTSVLHLRGSAPTLTVDVTTSASAGGINYLNSAGALVGQVTGSGATFSNGIYTGNQVAVSSYENNGKTTIVAGGTGGFINFATGGILSGNERMRLTAAGRLLLGTTSESTNILEVNGTARVSGTFSFGSANSYLYGDTNNVRIYDKNNQIILQAFPSGVGDGRVSIISAGNSLYTGASNGGFFMNDGAMGSTQPETFIIKRGYFGNVTSTTKAVLKVQTQYYSAITNGTILRGVFVDIDDTTTFTGFADVRAFESLKGGAYFNTTSVAASAILQADSTTKGFLPPRMTTVQRDAIATPATGLMVYNTTTLAPNVYNGTGWGEVETLTPSGRLLLGTTSESTFLLDVNGTARVSGYSTLGGIILTAEFAGPSNTYFNGPTLNTGNFYLRYATASLPATTVTTLNAQTVTASSSVGVLISSGVAVIGISNTAAASEWRFENYRNAVAGSLELSNSLSNPCVTYFASRSLAIGSYTETASAQLAMTSTTKGFLPPRMTTTQKNAIGTPAAGLQVYDTTLNQMSYYNGTTWVNF